MSYARYNGDTRALYEVSTRPIKPDLERGLFGERFTYLVFHAEVRGERFEAISDVVMRSMDGYEYIGTIRAASPESAYELCQGGIGNDMFVQENECRSLSVGDILMREDTRDFFGVASSGFSDLRWNATTNTVTA